MKAFLTAVVSIGILAVYSPSAHADSYRYLSKDEGGSATFINLTTINRIGKSVSVWLLTITGGYLRGGSPKPAYYLMQQSLNCTKQRIRPAAMSTYTETGTRIASDDVGGEEGVIEPGTIDQDILKIACLKKVSMTRSFEADSPHTLAKEFRADVLKLARQK